MDWPRSLAISGFLLLLLTWVIIISFLLYKYLTRGMAECKAVTPAVRRKSVWSMSQSGVRESLDTNTFFTNTEQDVSDRKGSLDSSS